MNITIDLSPADLDRLADAVAEKLRPDLAKVATAGGNSKGGRLLWREPEAAARLGMAAPTLKNWRLEGLIPCHSSRPVRYSEADLEAILIWLKSRGEGGNEK